LAKLGWKERANFRLDLRVSNVDVGARRRVAAELVATAPDVILCAGTQTTAILQELTSAIPIVFVNVADPIASGFVASFSRPGGNITGFTASEFSIAGKWLSIIKDVAPSTAHFMLLYDPSNSNWVGYGHTIEAAASTLKVSVS